MFNAEIIKEAIKNETLSLKKLATETKTPYSTLLNAVHAPVKGEAYDPEDVNIVAIESALKAKMGEEAFNAFNFESLIEASASAPLDISIGAKLTIKRGGGLRSQESVYEVVYVTETHVVLNDDHSTEPRVMAKKTLGLFGAKNVVPAVEETEE